MAREKKFTVKHFRNKRIKPSPFDNEHPLYVRLRYDNVQIDVASHIFDLAAIYLGYSEKINSAFVDVENIFKIKRYCDQNQSKLIEEEINLLKLIFHFYLKKGINILKGNTRLYIDNDLELLQFQIKQVESKSFFLKIQEEGYSNLYHILAKEGIDQLYIGLQQISNDKFRMLLQKFDETMKLLSAFDREIQNGKIWSVIHAKNDLEAVLMEFKEYSCARKLFKETIAFSSDQLENLVEIE